MSPLTNDYTDSMINEIIDVDSVINKINEEREKEKMEQIEQIKLYKGKIPNDIFNKLKIYKESMDLFKDLDNKDKKTMKFSSYI